MSNYPGAPGYVGSIPAWTTVPASSLPTATYIPALYMGPNVTYANGTRTDCTTYIDGSDYQEDISNTTFASQCDLALAVFGISFVDLATWNPSLAGSSISNCSFAQNESYCVRWSSIDVTTTGSVYPTAMPTGVSTVFFPNRGLFSLHQSSSYADRILVGLHSMDLCRHWSYL